MTKRFFTGALLLFLALDAGAQRITRHIVDPTTGTIVPAADPGEIIIEFAAPPLLARGAKAGLDGLFAQLERDLAAIERRGVAAMTEGPSAPDIRYRYTRTFAGASARVQPESIESIRQLSYVRSVHPDRVVAALLFESVEQIGAPAVWQEYGARGEGVVVAIIDSGIDYNHPALGSGFGTGFKVRGGRDFVNNDADPMDDNGHGTHVAGIVAANGVGLVGVSPDASLLAYKVLDQSGSGRDSYVLAAVEEVARQMPDVVNMSLGRAAVPDDPVVRAIEIAAATGIVFSVAAGNTGKFLDIGSPGNAPSVITVGAIDKQGRLASFSSKGPVVPTGSIKPEVVAPGVQILSARNGGGERTASGTSMAAPHVAGVAALLRDIHPDWSASRIRSAIINGARPLIAEVMVAGAGTLHAADAVRKNLQPSMETLSFGISDHLQQPWTASRSVTLTNRSETAQTLTLYIEGLREGIELTPSATSIALDAGASAQLDLALSVDHTKVVSPEAGSLSYGGLLRFTAEGGSISIPWSFVKARRLAVRWTGTGSAAVKLATERMMVAGTTTTDTQRVELFIGAGDVALWVAGEEARGSVHHVIRENLDLSATAEMAIGPVDAPHRIRFAGADVNGRLLGDRGGLDVRDVLFSHPYFSAVSLFDALAYLPSGRELFVSTLSPSTRVVAFERAFDESPAVTWSAVYEPLNGVDRDVDLTIPAGSWKSLSARGIVPEGLVHPYQAIFGAIWVRTGRQSLTSIARPNIVGPPVVGDTAVDAWITSAATDETITGIVVEMGDDEDEAPLSNSELIAEFTAVDGGVVGGRDRNLRISASVIPSHQPFTIGEGPACPNSIVSSVRGVMSARIEWSGPHGEDRIHDAKRTTASLYDGLGNLIATGTPLAPSDGFVMTTPLPQAGPYLLQASTSTFQTGGSAARGTLRIAFDSSKSDPMPPALTSLRIEDGGRTTSSLKGPSAATLTFAAVDYGTSNFADLQRDRTAVHYRRHGAGDDAWTPLSATVVAEDLPASPIGLFRVPDGVLYRVQLNQMQGAIDVRIAVEDAAGNRTEYVVEPAFVVSTGKRRAVAR